MKRRRCAHCAHPLAKRARADARFCSPACRVAHWRRRARTALALAHPRRCETCRRRIIAIGRRSDARFCSTLCRQRAYRQRKATAARPHKAHQRVIRDQLATSDDSRRTADISSAQVRAISTAEAKAIIQQYEWLGTMPAVSRYCFGIFFDGELGGAVVYGDEPAENLGVWDRYGFTGKIIALARGACLSWAHPHAASKLIRRSMDLLPKHYKVITATADRLAGEVGTIYQACGFDYVGVMRPGGRALIRVNGKYMSERQAGRLAGTRGVRALARLGFDAIPVPRRARYFAFRGDKRERTRNREAIGHLIMSYPRRSIPQTKDQRP